MDHDRIEHLRRTHPTLRLLLADNAPLIVSFLHAVFVKPNRRGIPSSELVSRLDDYLHVLRQRAGVDPYPKPAREYLEDWAASNASFLRKYYADLSDEPQFDITPAAERAIEWLRSLTESRSFVGTESRLMTIVQLLREIVQRSAEDPRVRVAELEKRRAEIDAEIAQVQSGKGDGFDVTQARERFLQAEETARRLLSDFRQVEQNFRQLDRETRERIAAGESAKGRVLDAVFDAHDVIWDSAEGRSFRAFWEFLMAPSRQEELERLLVEVLAISGIRSLPREPFLEQIGSFLIDAGAKVYRTNNLLVEQLRKFLDDRVYLENRRIIEIIRSIERLAIDAKDAPPEEPQFATLADTRPNVDLVMSRGLFTPPRNPVIEDVGVNDGDAEVDLAALYAQEWVDEEALRANIRHSLRGRAQVTLAQILTEHPPEKGVAEIVAYLAIAAGEGAAVDDGTTESTVVSTRGGSARRVTLPRIIFVR